MATFGETSFTGTTACNLENIINFGQFQMGSIDGIGQSITAKITITGNNHNIKCAIYDSSCQL